MQSSTRTPHEEIQKDPYLEAMHANAEVFDQQTERLFRYLQVSYIFLHPSGFFAVTAVSWKVT